MTDVDFARFAGRITLATSVEELREIREELAQRQDIELSERGFLRWGIAKRQNELMAEPGATRGEARRG